MPDITEETHLVVGHVHLRFYNERFRVYGSGHWTKKGDPYHQRCFIVLDPNSLDFPKIVSFDSLM